MFRLQLQVIQGASCYSIVEELECFDCLKIFMFPLNPINTQQMIEFFSKLKTPDFPAWLYSTTRSAPDLQSSDKHFARATWLAQLHIVQDQETCDQLHQRAVPVLKLFHRLHTIRFFIYLDDYPNIQTIAGSYLGVSTGLIRLLKRDSRDNSQLNALVAHELARTIHQDRFVEGRQRF